MTVPGRDDEPPLARILLARSLRFGRPELETAYQAEAVVPIRREAAIGSATSILLWLAAGSLIPRATAVDAAISTPVVLAMAGVNLVALWPIRRLRTLDDALLLLLVLNLVTGVAIVALAALTSAFERYAGPAVILQSTFALFIARRFVLTLTAGGFQLGLLAAVAVARGFPAGYVLDLFIVVTAVGVLAASTYVVESAARTGWYQRRLIAAQQVALIDEKARADHLLRNVLPGPVADRLLEREATIADGVGEASVLFADLVGFTPLAATLEPAQVVELLDGLFARFDDLADRFGVEKIKTIGDAYMAAAGVPSPAHDHADRIVRMGVAMLEASHAYAGETGLPLELRVGVHSGPVVAGVIGRRRFSYDLWGDTVNTASRMESHGVVGAVQASRATIQRLGPGFAVSARGWIELKGKGSLEAFLVSGTPPVSPT